MNVSIIGVPIFFGSDRKGVEFGPETLRENNIVDIIKNNGHIVYDLGNLHVPNVKKEDKFSSHNNMKYLSPIIEVNTNLAHQVYASLASGSFPFVIGGDHSLGLGSISGSSKYFDNIAVVWIDAHGDINTPETSPTGNIHGMPLAAAMGIGYEDLTNIYYDGIKVKPENVYIIGARDLDEGEIELISKFKLNVWSTKDVKVKGHEKVMEELINDLKSKNLENVHVSFDIDCIDASLVPGTGTPVNKGMSIEEVKYILKFLMKSNYVKAMDFVELNSFLDKNDTTLNLALELINFIFE